MNADPGLLTQLGEIFQRVLHDYIEAEHYYRPAAEAGSAKAMAELGMICHERRSFREAAGWLRRAVDAEPTGYAMMGLAHTLFQLGDRAEARLWCGRAADVDEFGADALLQLLDYAEDPQLPQDSQRREVLTAARWAHAARLLWDAYPSHTLTADAVLRESLQELIAEYGAMAPGSRSEHALLALQIYRIAATEAVERDEYGHAVFLARRPSEVILGGTTEVRLKTAELMIDIGEATAGTECSEDARHLLESGVTAVRGIGSTAALALIARARHATVETMLYEFETATEPTELDIRVTLTLVHEALTLRRYVLDPGDPDSVTWLAESCLLDAHLRIIGRDGRPDEVAVKHLAEAWELLRDLDARRVKDLRARARMLARYLNQSTPEATRRMVAEGRWPTRTRVRMPAALRRWLT